MPLPEAINSRVSRGKSRAGKSTQRLSAHGPWAMSTGQDPRGSGSPDAHPGPGSGKQLLDGGSAFMLETPDFSPVPSCPVPSQPPLPYQAQRIDCSGHTSGCFHPILILLFLSGTFHSSFNPPAPPPFLAKSIHTSDLILNVTTWGDFPDTTVLEWPGMCFHSSLHFFITLFTVHRHLGLFLQPFI